MTTIRRLVGVYDADGSVLGELRYFVGARLGRSHCALCDITHGLARERSTWRTFRSELPVPFDTFHRDDQPDDARAAHQGQEPVVLAATDDGFVVLLAPADLESCSGSVDHLSSAIDTAAAAAGLRWPT